MTKINVLQVLPTNKFSGAEKIAEQICENLNKDNFNSFILCNGGDLYERFIKKNFVAFELNTNQFYKLSTLLNFAKLVRERKINIVHAHGIRASIFSYFSKKLFRLDLVIVSHVHECSKWLESENYVKIIDRFIRNRFSLNILCGDKVYDHYERHGKYIDKSKVIVLSNAIELTNDTYLDNNNLKRKYNLGEEFVFGFVGRFSEPKGLIPFLSELSEKKEILEKAKLILVGDGEQDELLRKLVLEKDLQEKIIFTGNQENIFTYLSLFDLFLLPSLTEGLPMVILEAMSYKKPVLSFNVGSISQVIKNRYNGYLVDAGDYNNFFKLMDRLQKEKKQLKQLGDNARMTIVQSFDLMEYMTKLQKIYQGLFKGRNIKS